LYSRSDKAREAEREKLAKEAAKAAEKNKRIHAAAL
jgi:hypothetical protein